MSDLNPYEEGLAKDLAKAEARIEELEAKLEKVKAAFLINMMDALPNYTHAMFDKDYAKMMGETDA
jgi:hypothetical protein